MAQAAPHSYFRLRQVCLVTADLARAVEDVEAIFGVRLAYRDPNVSRYGLENALFPFGLCFVEIVAPVEPDTAAGRFLERTGGLGGYMAIFNCDDPDRRAGHAADLGVPVAHIIDHPGFLAYQLHPKQCRATMIEFDRSKGEEDPLGVYWPAGGTGWHAAVKTDVTRALAEAVFESPHPGDLAAHWARILERPVEREGEDFIIETEMAAMRFARGPREVLRALVVETVDPDAMLERAVARGRPVTDGAIALCGVAFRPRRAA